MTNTNPETGIRYGIISANSLDPEVICDLQATGRDVHWESHKQSAPNITWVFEVTHDITHYTRMESVSAPVKADHDKLVAELAALRYYAIRLDHKEWERWAWPGGYPIYYVCGDGGVLCSKCANKEIKLTSDPEIDAQWRITDADINYEDNWLYCDHCGERVESAYGDNNEQDKEPA